MKFFNSIEIQPHNDWLFLNDKEDLLIVRKETGVTYKVFRTKEGFFVRLPNGFVVAISDVSEFVKNLAP